MLVGRFGARTVERMGSTESPRENFLRAVGHEPPDWLPCPLFDGSTSSVGHGIAERVDQGLDAWGVRWEVKDSRSSSFPIRHPIASPGIIEDYPYPSVNPGIFEEAKKTASQQDRDRVIIFGDNGWGIFERAWLLLGMRRFFLWYYRYRDALRMLVERIAEVKLSLTEGLASEVGVDVVGYGDDWGMEDGLLLPKGIWEDLIKPWQSKLYRRAKDYDALIYQHSDGRVEELVGQLVEMGVDLLNVQRECNNWSNLVGGYGDRITLWGGVSARTLDLGSPSDIAGEVEECCELGRGGGIILAPGHSLHYPERNLEIMRGRWVECGCFGGVPKDE